MARKVTAVSSSSPVTATAFESEVMKPYLAACSGSKLSDKSVTPAANNKPLVGKKPNSTAWPLPLSSTEPKPFAVTSVFVRLNAPDK